MSTAGTQTPEAELDDVRARRLEGRTYRDAVSELWGGLGIWDLARYDAAGDLWLGPLRVRDAVSAYGTPIEIIDATAIERRCTEWMALAAEAARARGYPGRLRFLYASKANMAAEVVHAAYRAGWDAETSSAQDLAHLRWLDTAGLLPRRPRVVCNGFKLPPESWSAGPAARPGGGDLELPPAAPVRDAAPEPPYAEKIAAMAAQGWDILPILDTGELGFFARPGMPAMNVGLRMKLGPAGDEAGLGQLVSRFGYALDALADEARRVAACDHLRLTALHGMVGAAMSTPIPTLIDALGLAARTWAELRLQHPHLHELNMGGGVPPLGEPYDHRGLLDRLFERLAAEASAVGVPPPDLTFEFGSLVTAEAGTHVFRVLSRKQNDPEMPWAIVDGGLMAAIPDMLLIDKPFRCVAVTDADSPARAFRLGDLTCDSDGRYPPKSFGRDACVLLPDAESMWVALLGVGAYQETLAGVRGAHHCGLLEAIELILEHGPDGRPRARVMPRQTRAEAATMLGYSQATAEALRGLPWRSHVS